MESKTEFLKEQLALKGIYDYTEEDIKFLKIEMIDAMHYGKKDKYEAFNDAFFIWQRRKKNERD